MIRALRRKFVLVTMLYLLIVFALLYTADRIYNNYWSDMDALSLLEWVAASGELLANGETVKDERLFRKIEEQENPICGIVVDSDGNIRYQRHLDTGNRHEIERSVADAILKQPKNKYKYGNYLYIIEPLSNGGKLMVLMDTSYHENAFVRALYTLLIASGGISVLLLITVYLSRYVTEPARKALEREKQFVTDASHELKTPLGAISANAQALEMNEGNIAYINNIISETSRMNRLIERLLTLSRIEEEVVPKRELFSLSEVLEEEILTYESVAFDKKRRMEYEIQESVKIRGDADEIRQLIVILLDNAIKNAGEGGKIEITLSQHNNEVLLSVRNNGELIKSNDMEHIFERFYTGDLSRHGDSFGLGLSIAKAIVDNHGGTIDASSNIEEGTVFVIRFKDH